MRISRLKYIYLLLGCLCIVCAPLLTFAIYPPGLSAAMKNSTLRLILLGLTALLGSLFFRLWELDKLPENRRGWAEWLCASLLFSSCLYVALSYLPEITNYPFTLTWSEASRYYLASLYLAPQIYGQQVPPTVLHPSRYILQAIPFLLPDSPLWLHRAWQALLWLAAPLAAGGLLALRLRIPDRLHRWMLIAAAFLYLMIGPVYYHLLVPIILIVWGFHSLSEASPRLRFGLSLLVVLLASAWAGISRINWFPVPGSLAAALILLEEPVLNASDDSKSAPARRRAIGNYLLRLIGWFLLGVAAAFTAQVLYILWSGNQAEQFTTSLTSDLLWHRLLPNATYPPGILLAGLLVTLPIALVVLGSLLGKRGGWRDYHPLRLIGLAGILLVFLAGGVIVSLKIGGGSNLHNLDAYMVFLLVIGSYFFFGRLRPEAESLLRGAAEGPSAGRLSRVLQNVGLALLLLVSTSAALVTRRPASALPHPLDVSRSLETIKQAAEETRNKGGEVLFISNRQLLTFHQVDVPLIPDYERVFLMEVAMAGDPVILGRFYDDLQKQRFALIVSEPLSREQKGPKEDFGAENNAWVKHVARYILCYYEPVRTLRTVQVQLLTPLAEPKAKCP